MAKKVKTDEPIIINARLLAELDSLQPTTYGTIEFTAEQDQMLKLYYTKVRYVDIKKLWVKYFGGKCPSAPTLRKRYIALTGNTKRK